MKPFKSLCLLFSLVACLTPTLAAAVDSSVPGYRPEITFTLRTSVAEGKLVYIGIGGTIDKQVNPDLIIPSGATVQVNLVNGDGALHDIVAPDFNAQSDRVAGQESSTVMAFRADRDGEFFYWCSVPGHRAAGMEGKIIVGESAKESAAGLAVDLSRSPMEVPKPLGTGTAQAREYTLETIEKIGLLADGSTYRYWTFDGQVPGPLLRVRVGDQVTIHLSNAKDSTMVHSVDFHAVTGPGGGAAVTQAAPGKTESFSFRAMKPGLFVYHCATPMVAHHIANGMYGMILVEPPEGLPEVDREFYIMQGEIYTTEPYGKHGELSFSLEKLLNEQPEYLLFNGSVNALKTVHVMEANVGETVRMLFGVGGPNATSSFHVIGEIFDRVYSEGAITDPPLHAVQTTTVAPGGAVMVEFDVDYPGRYILVDHALSRMERGLAGFLFVKGKADPDIFNPIER